jgi:hypothetical protein
MHEWRYFRRGRTLYRFRPSHAVQVLRDQAWVRSLANDPEPLFTDPDYDEITASEADALTVFASRGDCQPH